MTPLLVFSLWVAGGYQVLGPWRLLARESSLQGGVAQVAALLWLTLAVVALGSLWLDPEPAVAQGLAPPWTERPWLLAGALAWCAVLAGDLLLAQGGREFGRPGRWLLAAISLMALLLALLGLERLRQGAGPSSELGGHVLAMGAGLLLALAGGELLLSGRPFWSLPAAAALPLWQVVLTPEQTLALSSVRPTLWIASTLLLLARFVPKGFRRPALALGLALAALWIDRASAVSHGLGTWLELEPPWAGAP